MVRAVLPRFPSLKAGICIPGNGKALVKLRSAAGDYLVAASQNKDVLKVYQLHRKMRTIPLLPDDINARITFANGKIRKKNSIMVRLFFPNPPDF